MLPGRSLVSGNASWSRCDLRNCSWKDVGAGGIKRDGGSDKRKGGRLEVRRGNGEREGRESPK